MRFWNWLKTKILGFKVINKDQYNKIVKMLILKKDELFKEADANGDGEIQVNEILKGIKAIIKMSKEVEEEKKEETSEEAK